MLDLSDLNTESMEYVVRDGESEIVEKLLSKYDEFKEVQIYSTGSSYSEQNELLSQKTLESLNEREILPMVVEVGGVYTIYCFTDTEVIVSLQYSTLGSVVSTSMEVGEDFKFVALSNEVIEKYILEMIRYLSDEAFNDLKCNLEVKDNVCC